MPGKPWSSSSVGCGAAEDAHAALAFLRAPAAVAKYRIDVARIAVAGHSMGGFMAADAAVDDPRVVGLLLIDAWDIGADAASLSSAAGRKAWHDEIVGDLPPLAGTSEQALTREMAAGAARFGLVARAAEQDHPVHALVLGKARRGRRTVRTAGDDHAIPA